MTPTLVSPLASDEATPKKGDAWIGYLIVFVLVTLFLYLLHFRNGIFVWRLSQQDGAPWIDEALLTLLGDLIYRDFFEMMPPGIVYVNAFFMWLLGPTTTTVGIIIVLLGVAGALATYAVSGAVLSGLWRYVPAAIFAGITYPSYVPGNHKWPTIFFCLVGILVVVKTRSRLRSALSGIAHGCAILCTQDLGAGAAFGMFVALWLLRDRKDGADPYVFAIACALTVLGVLGGFGVAAGFWNVWYAVVAFMFEQYGTSHMLAFGVGEWTMFPVWLASFGLGGLGLAYALIGIARRFWRSDAPPLVIIALAGTGLMLIGGLVHPIEPTLFGVRAVPLTIVGLYALQRAVERHAAQWWPRVALLASGGDFGRLCGFAPGKDAVHRTTPYRRASRRHDLDLR